MFHFYFCVYVYTIFLLKCVRGITLLDCECGNSKSSSVSFRIFGGIEAAEDRYPWIIYMEYRTDRYCGGVLINNLYILTSGHCVNDEGKINFKIYLNPHDRHSSKPIKLRATETIRHPDYKVESTRNIINDVALIKLDSPVDFNGNIYPICLPHPESEHSKKTAKILGWGLNEGGTSSDILREAEVQVMSDGYCEKSAIGKYYRSSMICGFSESSDACQGDSGGPLFYRNAEDKDELIALISWGIKCGTKLPGIYTKVSRFMDWIEENTQDAGYCNA